MPNISDRGFLTTPHTLKMMKIYIVIPCYNEEEVLCWAVDKLQTVVDRLRDETATEARLMLVDDGSSDKTWPLICQLTEKFANISGIRLSHNVGHQRALWAGLEQTVDQCDAAVSIDADLQDDENAIIDMVKQVKQGCDIVYGVRKERKTDAFFKRFTAQTFYRLMRSVDQEMIYNHADYRMMATRTVRALLAFPERNLFLRGLVRQLGFNEGLVFYNRTARTAGQSKYPLHKMLSFSVDGITSFSTAPLKWITVIGLLMTLVSVVMIGFALIEYAQGNTIQGWTSTLTSLWFIGGVVTTGVGITGVYVGKIYTEVKRRPRYFVMERRNGIEINH